MSDYPRMLYRHGGTVQLQDGGYHTLIVNSRDEHDAADDWHLTPADAKTNAQKAKADASSVSDRPPTREEIQQRLDELGIDYDKRLGVVGLMALLPK